MDRSTDTSRAFGLLLGLLFACINVCYAILLNPPVSIVAVPYVLLLEFAAVGVSFQLAELGLCCVVKALCPPKLSDVPRAPPVALVCVTCDDVDSAVLEALQAQSYPNLEIFVLDDSRSDVHQRCVDNSGLRTVRRRNRRGNKAGNLNHWLLHHGSNFKYFVVADADSVLPPSFVQNMVQYAEHPGNDTVAIFESFVRAWNKANVFASLLDATTFIKDQYRLRVTNRLGSTLSVGHNNLYRTLAIQQNGGFLEDFLAEDFATCISVTSGGLWSCKIVPVLSYERQPENISEFTRRQSRWAYQTLQLLNLEVAHSSWCMTLELLRAVHYYLSPLVMIGGLVLTFVLSIQQGVLFGAPIVAFPQIESRTEWHFWLVWFALPTVTTWILARRERVRVEMLLRSMLLQGALFTVTLWPVARHVLRYFFGYRVGFTVTGRSAAPALLHIIRRAGPTYVLFWVACASVVSSPDGALNLVWIAPGCIGPLVVHWCHRSTRDEL